MAKGKPGKWAKVTIEEPFLIGKRGITITVGDRYGRKPLGYAKIAIGGIRWTPFNKQKGRTVKWDKLVEL